MWRAAVALWLDIGFKIGGFNVRNQILLKNRIFRLFHVAVECLQSRVNCPLTDVVRILEEGFLAQASPLSSDHRSKLRGLSQNSPHVVSKTMTKLSYQICDFRKLSLQNSCC
ncbi:hypothetical protein AVEN_25455-1 [Araneus ventricosus]|uniref:Uncharacterized protein n=1 Tax=Araneus ventricosus TaxID=182803 RepID=A0A4Y2KXR7_ARAVE|nr:hypothetical protein AVEN_25455-1 [Araneus ventricosus]